jgi:hypothetical protein
VHRLGDSLPVRPLPLPGEEAQRIHSEGFLSNVKTALPAKHPFGLSSPGQQNARDGDDALLLFIRVGTGGPGEFIEAPGVVELPTPVLEHVPYSDKWYHEWDGVSTNSGRLWRVAVSLPLCTGGGAAVVRQNKRN